jgi:hypothetical protein
MATIAVHGNDGLVDYIADRLVERGHIIAAQPDIYVRVVDPTRESIVDHATAITEAARQLARGAVTISIVTRHGDKLLKRYKAAVREAHVVHGIAGIRSVGIVTGEVRDPATTGMTPVTPEVHEALFGESLNPDTLVLAIEIMASHDDRRIEARALSPWLRVGDGIGESLVVRVARDTEAVALVGDELATYWVPRAICPRDFEDYDDHDDFADIQMIGLAGWVGAINRSLDKAVAKLAEPRRAWIVDREHVAFTTAREWARLSDR